MPDQTDIHAMASHVFMTSNRCFSFTHRHLLSLRHPCLSYCWQLSANHTKNVAKRLIKFTELCMRASEQLLSWNYVGELFDSKIDTLILDSNRQQLFTNNEIVDVLEKLWSLLNTEGKGGIDERTYNELNRKVIKLIFNTEDVTIETLLLPSVTLDFAYDSDTSTNSVPFNKFCLSMLELADNWVYTRKAKDYVEFYKLLVGCYKKETGGKDSYEIKKEIMFSPNAHFSGGVVTVSENVSSDKPIMFQVTRL